MRTVTADVVIAIDPGIRGTGLAAGIGRDVIAGTYVKNPLKKGHGPRECAAMGAAVAAQVSAWFGPERLKLIITEWPQIYVSRIQERKTKENPNDLLPLAGVDSVICAHFPLVEVKHLVPHDWKGSMDADAMTERIKRRMTEAETACMVLPSASLAHNVYDAVGIFLAHVGRLERQRAFHTA